MLEISFRQVKATFAAQKVSAKAHKGTVRALKRAGGLVRTTARRSMRKGGKPSQPGQPPKVRRGQLKKFLFFVVDERNESTVVGPVRLSDGTGAPRILEYGGIDYREQKGRTVAAQYEPRPFMGPALETQTNKLPALWEGALKG